ncbi:MAG: RHS repeat-associated core domain-containing protein [Anaerolineae bacterium]|nr:RHS repeat-associated core domain-containing protein [Anaerolineae bacterium]
MRQLTEPAGDVLLAQTFDPYGSLYARAGEGVTSFGFTGEYGDTNGLLYLRARYYVPGRGRFFQLDPSRQEVNLYQYSGSNPIIYTDPGGYCYGQFSFLRDLETQNCANLDLALQIAAHPNATDAEKRVASAYIGAWGISHVYLGVGILGLAAASPVTTAVGAGIGAGYAGVQYELAKSGACGCEAQAWASGIEPGEYYKQAAILGGSGGALFAGIGGLGAGGQLALSGMGITGGSVGVYASGQDIAANGVTPCNALNLGVSALTLAASSYQLQQAVAVLQTSQGVQATVGLNTGNDPFRIIDEGGMPRASEIKTWAERQNWELRQKPQWSVEVL